MDSLRITEHQFNFKGFSTRLTDDAQDENGNHIIVGEIEALEELEEDRDTSINRIFGLKKVYSDDRFGILIVTDSNYKILKVVRSFIGKKIIYDSNSKHFIIGANFFDYIEVDGEYTSAWQPVVLKLNLELETEFYFLKKDYSCILQDMHLEKDRIILFTRSTNNEILKKRKEKAEVIVVSTEELSRDNEERINVFKPLSASETIEDSGRVTISKVSFVNGNYYFTGSTLDQYTLTNTIKLYRFHNSELEEIEDFQDFLQYAMKYYGWIHLNDFSVDSVGNCYILSHKAATKKEITFVKADTSFRQLEVTKIPLNEYAELNDFLVLKNGNVVITSVNEDGNWSYYVYSKEMMLLQEIKTSLYRKYLPIRLKETENNQLLCLFSVDITSKHDCLLHTVKLR